MLVPNWTGITYSSVYGQDQGGTSNEVKQSIVLKKNKKNKKKCTYNYNYNYNDMYDSVRRRIISYQSHLEDSVWHLPLYRGLEAPVILGVLIGRSSFEI